ncbi:growth arrest-specific protein 2-like [Engraulis encrasicolus]|uniref:growth arrest-specific protein 2-like n=1 Tax=Engraulis encrasicolus TaxID=184585 RepID=UPI002FD2D94F
MSVPLSPVLSPLLSPLSTPHPPTPHLTCLNAYSDWLAARHHASLQPMTEDLALWIHTLLGVSVTADDLIDRLETGVLLCQLAEELQERMILGSMGKPFIRRVIRWREDAAPASFFARDNIANFLYWCRKIGVEEPYLFESEDLVMKRHPKEVCLCLLQVGRIASRYGVDAPGLVMLERELEREEAGGSLSPSLFFPSPLRTPTSPSPSPSSSPLFSSSPSPSPSPSPPLASVPTPTAASTPARPAKTPSQGRRKVLPQKSPADQLDDLVRQICENPPCVCAVRFCVEKQPKGRYRVGDKVLYVRMLNDRHAMVRVGGGWEAFACYLQKHDPCRQAPPPLPGTRPRSRGNTNSNSSSVRSVRLKDLSADTYLVVGTSPSHFRK